MMDALDLHVHHTFSHPEMESRLRLELEGEKVQRDQLVDFRLNSHAQDLSQLKRFMWLLSGMGIVIALELTAFGAVLLTHLKWP